jgi:hypothetical protein
VSGRAISTTRDDTAVNSLREITRVAVAYLWRGNALHKKRSEINRKKKKQGSGDPGRGGRHASSGQSEFGNLLCRAEEE